MAERERERFSPPAVGGISLLVVFAVLCLTVFALLSLATVRADSRLADASAQAVSDYYAADRAAQEILARLRAGDIPEGVGVQGDIYVYACPISDTQSLEVEVELTLDGGYTVLRWQAVSAGGAAGEGGYNIWDGTLP